MVNDGIVIGMSRVLAQSGTNADCMGTHEDLSGESKAVMGQ